ncbi:restriction endonuclease subunit S [Streptomyces sp. ISL-94]|uniref:restriction endonuclease subunit S n=1 Tax=Streptomyces sp. ISL-94 TaxID=2819190 RepID=UPI001BE88F66|nr:restriction endonuclease subunit S [Streptomyces sp. ISL-94]MBT2478708.1 restriction endonuclease subunit S [Streptomyces sp. ISL-94]
MSENEQRNPLPPGWVWASIGEIAEVSGGIQKQQKRRPVENKFPFLRVANVGRGSLNLAEVHEVELFDGEIDRYRIEVGDLLVVEGNGSPDQIGRAARWRGSIKDAVHQNHLIRVRPNKEISPIYLEAVWNSPVVSAQLLEVAQSTSGLYTLSTTKVKRVVIPLPSLAEQQRILDTLEDHISRLDAAQALVGRCSARLGRLRDTVSSPIFGYAVNADSEAASFLPPAGTIDDDLPRVPLGWSWRRLEDVADVVGGVTKDSKKQSDPDLPEVPYLRVANVQRGRLDLNQVSMIRVPEGKAAALALQPGDVLMNEGGDRNKLGRGWIWEGQIPGAIHQNHVFRARVRDGEIDPKLLSWYANSSVRWFEQNGKQSVNLASISVSKIKKFPVPIPPVAEQSLIVERVEDDLSVMDNVLEVIARSHRRSSSLRRALLERAFSGRLVPQDANDESASALLARIEAERQTVVARPARRRATQRTRITNAQQELDA